MHALAAELFRIHQDLTTRTISTAYATLSAIPSRGLFVCLFGSGNVASMAWIQVESSAEKFKVAHYLFALFALSLAFPTLRVYTLLVEDA
jgi:hypothetical protein